MLPVSRKKWDLLAWANPSAVQLNQIASQADLGKSIYVEYQTTEIGWFGFLSSIVYEFCSMSLYR